MEQHINSEAFHCHSRSKINLKKILLFSILGNGWALMGAADALIALEFFPELRDSQEYEILLKNFQNHAGNLSLWQSQENGRWHNIIKGIFV